MRNARLFLLALSALLLLCSCDGLRSLAGRPTSADIAVLRERIEKEQAHLKKLEEDSIARVQARIRYEADSLEAVDSLSRLIFRSSRTFKTLDPSSADFTYCVMMGSFQNPLNASELLDKIVKAGYPGTIIAFRNGLNAVCAAPVNSKVELWSYYRKLRLEEFCPHDSWILFVEKDD